jgi:hypothetical protein
MISFWNLLMAFLESERYVSINVIRLIKDFDREIKDEGAGNPEEVNKQLNDEKQSMVNIRTLFFLGHVGNLVSTSSKF